MSQADKAPLSQPAVAVAITVAGAVAANLPVDRCCGNHSGTAGTSVAHVL